MFSSELNVQDAQVHMWRKKSAFDEIPSVRVVGIFEVVNSQNGGISNAQLVPEEERSMAPELKVF